MLQRSTHHACVSQRTRKEKSWLTGEDGGGRARHQRWRRRGGSGKGGSGEGGGGEGDGGEGGGSKGGGGKGACAGRVCCSRYSYRPQARSPVRGTLLKIGTGEGARWGLQCDVSGIRTEGFQMSQCTPRV